MDQPIIIPTARLSASDLEQFRNSPFENMIKFAVDVRLERIAFGGEMHSDGEEALLRAGSHQPDIWGGNLWPWEMPPRIEYISLINIRPSEGNPGMEIELDHIRAAAEKVVRRWVGLP